MLIGAARSGTKIMRDTLGRLPGVAPVPYDMNFVWRIGNGRLCHDEIRPGSVSTRQERRIRRLLLGSRVGDGAMLEKTVSNALRVDFVRSVFPNARFIHLVRDGVDVAESVMRQWSAPSDLKYLSQKLRAVPASASPSYAAQYARGLVRRRIDGGASTTWGPRYEGIDDDLHSQSLATVCARQWRRCVESATDSLRIGPASAVFTIRYESLVSDPKEVLSDLAMFLGIEATDDALRLAAAEVVPSTVGRGRAALSTNDRREVEDEVARLSVDLPHV